MKITHSLSRWRERGGVRVDLWFFPHLNPPPRGERRTECSYFLRNLLHFLNRVVDDTKKRNPF